jgi:hypothetical protein
VTEFSKDTFESFNHCAKMLQFHFSNESPISKKKPSLLPKHSAWRIVQPVRWWQNSSQTKRSVDFSGVNLLPHELPWIAELSIRQQMHSR